MRIAYLLGVWHKIIGYSIHYNPFRHKGSSQEYVAWSCGWKHIKKLGF